MQGSWVNSCVDAQFVGKFVCRCRVRGLIRVWMHGSWVNSCATQVKYSCVISCATQVKYSCVISCVSPTI
jgi:hypothetical protein